MRTVVRVRSVISGQVNAMEMPISEQDLRAGLFAWKELHLLIQDAFPTLPANCLEFLRTGMSQEEQDRIFKKKSC